MSDLVLLDLDAYEEQSYTIPATKYFGFDLKIKDISCERWMELEKVEQTPKEEGDSVLDPLIRACMFLLEKDNPEIKKEQFTKMTLGQLSALLQALKSLAQKSFLGKGLGQSQMKAPKTIKE